MKKADPATILYPRQMKNSDLSDDNAEMAVQVYKWMVIENVITLIACGATMVGLYAFGAGAHSFWALLLLLNLNTGSRKGQ